jgi:hypothetical protein
LHEISKQRFDILAAYARGPLAPVMGREIAWFEVENGDMLGSLWIDTDGEFVGVALAPDLRDRYRAVHVTKFYDTWQAALAELRMHLSSTHADGGYAQGDEVGRPIDFFAPVAPEAKLSSGFRLLLRGAAFSAARAVIDALMRWYEDVDGNFIEQFQTRGFDARLWELYLFATLTEANLAIDRPKPAPDFVARGLLGEFAIEATTVNLTLNKGAPAPSVRPTAGHNDEGYRLNYLPIKYAGPLTTKLKKRYWESPGAAGLPLVFAIQDFHDTLSMTYSGSTLSTYLYGWRHEPRRDEDGRLVINPIRVSEHRWGSKVVPSGFFYQPDAEHISAVIFNSLGTLSKFNRMGVQAGFGHDGVTLVHSGTVADPDPDASEARPFSAQVTIDSRELWVDGMDVFHNPNALLPLDPDFLPYAAHHRLLPNGLVETTAAGDKIISSITTIIVAHPTTE